MSFPAPTLLDVTLRDGGFHNHWAFSPTQIAAYLKAADAAQIPWIEIGYRSRLAPPDSSPLRTCPEPYLASLPKLRHAAFAVMVDAKEFDGYEDAFSTLFGPAEHSLVKLVRLAFRPNEFDLVSDLTHRANALGYAVAINVMTFSLVPPSDQAALFRRMATLPATVASIADSFGSMTPDEVARATRTWRDSSALPFGVHLHDAQALALESALAALDAGASWIDASVLGMGRGPGNLRLEAILPHLGDPNRVLPIAALIRDHWQALHDAFRWGPHPAYARSALLDLHPSYPQELLRRDDLTAADRLQTVEHLGSYAERGRFSPDTLEAALAALDLPRRPPQ